jgi:hypothetical protein
MGNFQSNEPITIVGKKCALFEDLEPVAVSIGVPPDFESSRSVLCQSDIVTELAPKLVCLADL